MAAKKKSIKKKPTKRKITTQKKASSKKETTSVKNKTSSKQKIRKNMKAKTKAKVKTKTKTKVKTKTKTKVKVKTKTKVKVKTKTKVKVKTKAKAKVKTKTKAKVKTKIKTKVKVKTKTEANKRTKRPQPKTIKPKKLETNPSTAKVRKYLVANQQELLNIIQTNQSAERKTSESNFSNEIDMASDLEGREMMFQLTSRDRSELKKIQEAIYKIDHGTYGICENCSKKISSKRLKILPLSILCIDCKELMEQA
jgi:DnaK suppressor protein